MGSIHSPFCFSQRFLKTPKSTTIFGMENSLKETPKAAFGDSRLPVPLWQRVHTTWHISLDHEPHSWQYVQHSIEPFLGRCRRRWSFCSGPSPGLCCLLLELLWSRYSQRRDPHNSWNTSLDHLPVNCNLKLPENFATRKRNPQRRSLLHLQIQTEPWLL